LEINKREFINPAEVFIEFIKDDYSDSCSQYSQHFYIIVITQLIVIVITQLIVYKILFINNNLHAPSVICMRSEWSSAIYRRLVSDANTLVIMTTHKLSL